ncbi:MAG: ATP-binding protein, partial [Thermoanaerobaculia bacterium]
PTRPPAAAESAPRPAASHGRAATAPPVLPPDVQQRFLPLPAGAGSAVSYEPNVLGLAKVHYLEKKQGVATAEAVRCLAPIPPDATALDWATAEALTIEPTLYLAAPPAPGAFDELPAAAARGRSYAVWSKSFAEHLYRTRRLELHRSPALGESSRPGESERDFRLRCGQLARERRDAAVEELRARTAKRAAALAERLHKAEQRREREQDQAARQKYDTVVSVGATVLSALLGRKRASMSSLGRATTAARGWGRAQEQVEDVERAAAASERLAAELAELESELAAETATLAARFDLAAERLEVTALAPRKADIEIELVALAWRPRTG